jgi:cation diffusion facilitator family transporter
MVSTRKRVHEATRVTWIGFVVNLVLVIGKLAAGILGHSMAMIADAVHSLSDFATDVVVLVSIPLAGRPADRDHDYGHGKYETLATTIIGVALVVVGVGILYGGARRIYASVSGTGLESPRYIALAAAVVSVVTKEWLYRFTVRVGRRIQSQAVLANAWHHRSDAFSSIGTMLGIGGAIVLGPRWHVLDPIAAVIVSGFILKVGVGIARGSLKELTESSLNDAEEMELMTLVTEIPSVLEAHSLRTRRVGNAVAVDLHVVVDRSLGVVESHDVASRVEAVLQSRYGEGTLISVHIEPTADPSDEDPRS